MVRKQELQQIGCKCWILLLEGGDTIFDSRIFTWSAIDDVCFYVRCCFSHFKFHRSELAKPEAVNIISFCSRRSWAGQWPYHSNSLMLMEFPISGTTLTMSRWWMSMQIKGCLCFLVCDCRGYKRNWFGNPNKKRWSLVGHLFSINIHVRV